MKLLVVASTFPAHEADSVPAFVRDQLIALKTIRPGLQISVLAPHDRRSRTVAWRQWPQYDEYRFHYFWPFAAEKLAGRGIMPALKANPLNHLLIPFLFLGEFVALWSLTRKLKPDVLYAHWFTPQGIVCSWVSRMTGTPFVFTTHASDVAVWRRIPWIGRYVVRSSAKRARAFTAVSRRSMSRFRSFFSARQWETLEPRGAIVPMGVAMPPSPPADRNPTPFRTTILFLGRLVEKKGVQYLLQAYAGARAGMGDSVLVIAGDGPMRTQLQQQADKLGLGSQVRFTGFVSGADKAALLREADIHVVPSIITGGDAEGLPVSLLEGLAHAKLCIATIQSGADDVLTNGEDGLLVPERDSEALSTALIQIAQMDVASRTAMKCAARRTALRFDWETIARRHDEVLFQPVDPARRGACPLHPPNAELR